MNDRKGGGRTKGSPSSAAGTWLPSRLGRETAALVGSRLWRIRHSGWKFLGHIGIGNYDRGVGVTGLSVWLCGCRSDRSGGTGKWADRSSSSSMTRF